MRSRFAIAAALLLGTFLTVGGVAVAVTGPSGSRDVGKNQYGHGHHHHGNGNDNNDENQNENLIAAPPAGSPPGHAPGQGRSPSENGGRAGEGANQGVQAGAQGGLGPSGQVPFTGFAAIPVLLAGVALIALGLAGRRRTRSAAARAA